MNARFYVPGIGRFASADTIVPKPFNSQSLNRYSYVNNNPLKYMDPTGHAAYCGDDYDPACLDDGEQLDFQRMTGTIPPLPEVPDSSPSGDQASPFDVGVEWLTGTGERHHEFRDGDIFTELLQQHDHVSEVRERIAARLEQDDFRPGKDGYDLSGWQGVPKYVKDYSTLATFGQTGNLAVTYLGSFALEYHIVSIDEDSGTVEVLFHVSNSSSFASATRPPILGYTKFWQDNVAPRVNAVVQGDGSMSTVTQDFWWTETINYTD